MQNQSFFQENFQVSFDSQKGQLYFSSVYCSESLTKRETDVLKCLLQGFSAKKIGLSLGISNRTAESYLNNIKLKLGCNKKSDIISICFSIGVFKLLF
jgi:DNA-binding CsgD family transcriptional regulator